MYVVKYRTVGLLYIVFLSVLLFSTVHETNKRMYNVSMSKLSPGDTSFRSGIKTCIPRMTYFGHKYPPDTFGRHEIIRGDNVRADILFRHTGAQRHQPARHELPASTCMKCIALGLQRRGSLVVMIHNRISFR